ncbi:hypothetical protein RYX36_007233 [Vicia faba]
MVEYNGEVDSLEQRNYGSGLEDYVELLHVVGLKLRSHGTEVVFGGVLKMNGWVGFVNGAEGMGTAWCSAETGRREY